MPFFDARTVGRLAGALLIGVVVGGIGTIVHRAVPWGLALAMLAVVAAGIFARAWAGGGAVAATGIGVVTTVAVLGMPGPGGDVLIVADAVGWVWAVAASLVGVAYLCPRSWFVDTPIGRGGRA